MGEIAERTVSVDASYKEVPLLNGQQKRTRRGAGFFASTEGQALNRAFARSRI
jgi:hypothetical protein